jgi:hypothetical protein
MGNFSKLRVLRIDSIFETRIVPLNLRVKVLEVRIEMLQAALSICTPLDYVVIKMNDEDDFTNI